MKRVVVTGIGIVSSIGNNYAEVKDSLFTIQNLELHSNLSYAERGLRSNVAGSLNIEPAELIDRKLYRFMANGHAYAWIAMQEAIADAKLTDNLCFQ